MYNTVIEPWARAFIVVINDKDTETDTEVYFPIRGTHHAEPSIFKRGLVELTNFAGSKFQRMAGWPSFDLFRLFVYHKNNSRPERNETENARKRRGWAMRLLRKYCIHTHCDNIINCRENWDLSGKGISETNPRYFSAADEYLRTGWEMVWLRTEYQHLLLINSIGSLRPATLGIDLLLYASSVIETWATIVVIINTNNDTK